MSTTDRMVETRFGKLRGTTSDSHVLWARWACLFYTWGIIENVIFVDDISYTRHNLNNMPGAPVSIRKTERSNVFKGVEVDTVPIYLFDVSFQRNVYNHIREFQIKT